VRAALLGAVARRPAGSALRRRVLTNSVRIGFDEMGQRGDRRRVDRMLRLYDPGCEIHFGPGFPLDAQPVYVGHDGVYAVLRLWDEVSTLSFVCEEVLDMGGPCFGLLVSVTLTGSESGVSVPPSRGVSIFTLARGGIVRQVWRNDGWEVAPDELTAALQRAATP
jgi:hypothetical protein